MALSAHRSVQSLQTIAADESGHKTSIRHQDSTLFSNSGVDPRPAPVRSTESRAARADPHAILEADAVGRHAHALAADARNGGGRANKDLVDTARGDAAGESGVAIVVELALGVGVVVGGFDDVDCDVVVCGRVSGMGE